MESRVQEPTQIMEEWHENIQKCYWSVEVLWVFVFKVDRNFLYIIFLAILQSFIAFQKMIKSLNQLLKLVEWLLIIVETLSHSDQLHWMCLCLIGYRISVSIYDIVCLISIRQSLWGSAVAIELSCKYDHTYRKCKLWKTFTFLL